MPSTRGAARPGGRVVGVQPGSIAEEIGVEPGDVLLSINERPLRDVIDYQFYGADEEMVLGILRDGSVHRVEVQRDYDEELGFVFAEPLFDGVRQCRNHCPFCFIAQMPRGMRGSLYIRDDDYRLSFLHGAYITLTNLTEDDWYRIGEQHLSPLYVSVHATSVDDRRRLLGNPQADDILPQLERLARLNVQVHAQIVIVPGLNDGAVLEESVRALLRMWPTVRTLALVPVGLTRHCNPALRPMDAEAASAILDLAEGLRPTIRRRTRRTWLFPSDELYLLTGRPVPPAAHYDDPAQIENGVGLVRSLLEDWDAERAELQSGIFCGLHATLVCGTLISPVLQRLAAEAAERSGAQLTVVPVTNRFFGETVTVSGLLTAEDVQAALQGCALGDVLCIPRAMLDQTGEHTLDDVTLEDLAEVLGVPVEPVATMGEVMDVLHGLSVWREPDATPLA
ncbi:MAG: DUF512 domain-containing protein [Anaerolineae bacterium]|jgi:putative radical SAM enzyme (TIGR03279 family)|nr:DUF512 domain-containing protein [Chloroflexota bacterium]